MDTWDENLVIIMLVYAQNCIIHCTIFSGDRFPFRDPCPPLATQSKMLVPPLLRVSMVRLRVRLGLG